MRDRSPKPADRPRAAARGQDGFHGPVRQVARSAPDLVFDLQRAAGNVAVSRLVDGVRDGPDVRQRAPSPLPATGVDAPASSGPDVPVQRATGLGRTKDVEAFAGNAAAHWNVRREKNPDLGLEYFAKDLIKEVASRLKHYGVPRLDMGINRQGSTGEFHPSTWTLFVNPVKLARGGGSTIGELTPKQVEEIVDTVYHEARHCEQWFRIARVVGARSDQPSIRKADEINARLGIPIDVAEAAARLPLADQGSHSYREAVGWEAFLSGRHRSYMNLVYRLLREERAAVAHAYRIRDDVKGEVEALPLLESAMSSLQLRQGEIDIELRRLSPREAGDAEITEHLVKMDNGISFSWRAWRGFQEANTPIGSLIGGLEFLEKFVYAAYTSLEHERDAWAVGAKARARFAEAKEKV